MKKTLILSVLLAGCCNGRGDPNCTVAQQQEFEAATIPVLVATQDGVRLYRVLDPNRNYVYFTTPCGDTSWQTSRIVGKAAVTDDHQVNGVGCR